MAFNHILHILYHLLFSPRHCQLYSVVCALGNTFQYCSLLAAIHVLSVTTLATRIKATYNGNLWQDQASQAFQSCCRRMADLQGEAAILFPCERHCRQLEEAFDHTYTVWKFDLRSLVPNGKLDADDVTYNRSLICSKITTGQRSQ